MKTNNLWKTAKLIVPLALILANTARAESTVKFESQPGSKIKIDGTSTVHDWTVETQAIGGSLEITTDAPVDPSKPLDLATVKAAPKVDLVIMVRSIKSGTKPMDTVMHNAMNMAEHPKIEYHLTEWSLKEAPKGPKGPATFTTKGELTVNAVKKTIEMPVTLELVDTGLKASGETAVKMTDFGIKPPAPTLGLGLIKTSDDVKITFVWLTAPAKN